MDQSLSKEDRAKLVALAREAVTAAVETQPEPKADDLAGVLSEQRGCFVTLTNQGRLRGCIGTFQPQKPLGQMIIEMGTAATKDPRFVFDPITHAELGQLKIEVSVLTPLKETAQPEKLEVGRHGIYIVHGFQSGCFLPEVATDWSWDAQEFLSQCCRSKAGLPEDAWKKPDTKVYLFESEKFCE